MSNEDDRDSEVTPVGLRYEPNGNGNGSNHDPILTLEEASHQIARLHRKGRKRDAEIGTIDEKLDAMALDVAYLRDAAMHNKNAVGRVTNLILTAVPVASLSLFLGSMIGSLLLGSIQALLRALLGH